MGIDAGVTVVFLNEAGEKVDREYIDCYKCSANGDTFNVPSGTHKVKVYFSTEDDRYIDSDGDSSDDDDYWNGVDIERIMAACKEEINMNDATREYWTNLKCDPEVWSTLICTKCTTMEKDDESKKMLKRLNSFEDFLDDFVLELPPKSILEFLEFIANIEPMFIKDDEADLDYKTLVKIMMECFEEGAAHLEMNPADSYMNDSVC